jgi:hypothetical protein
VADDQPVVLDDDPVDDQLCRRRVDAGPSAFSVQESTSFIGFYITRIRSFRAIKGL